MVYKFTAIRADFDPAERAARLRSLYHRFESTPTDPAILAESESAGAEAKAVKLQRGNNNTSLKKQQSEVNR